MELNTTQKKEYKCEKQCYLMVSLRVKAIKSYCLMLLIVLFLSLSFFISSPPKILANPIYAPPPPDLGSGHILLPSDYNLSLVEAEVKMEIETREEGGYYMPIHFDGNYTIYNPDSTVTVNISAPFSPYIAALAVDMHIKINDQVVDDEWDGYFYDPYSTPWDEYLTGYRYIITVRNVTIIGASNTTIRFSYETSIFRNKMRIEKEWVFYYDVGSARAWKGNVTERVELVVKGFQAIDYYISPYPSVDFTLDSFIKTLFSMLKKIN